MRVSLLVLATLLAAATAAAQGAACNSALTLVGLDDLKWYVEGARDFANPRLVACPATDIVFTIRVPADETVPHNFVVEAPGAPPLTDTLSAGDEITYTWSTPADGSFSYVCKIHPDTMRGTVLVASEAPAEAENGTPAAGLLATLGALLTLAWLVGRRGR